MMISLMQVVPILVTVCHDVKVVAVFNDDAAGSLFGDSINTDTNGGGSLLETVRLSLLQVLLSLLDKVCAVA